MYTSFRRVCSEDRLASDLCIQTHIAWHSIYLSEEGAESLCVRKTYIWRDQGWSWKSPHYNSSCRWWCYILPDKWFVMSGIKKNHSSIIGSGKIDRSITQWGYPFEQANSSTLLRDYLVTWSKSRVVIDLQWHKWYVIIWYWCLK